MALNKGSGSYYAFSFYEYLIISIGEHKFCCVHSDECLHLFMLLCVIDEFKPDAITFLQLTKLFKSYSLEIQRRASMNNIKETSPWHLFTDFPKENIEIKIQIHTHNCVYTFPPRDVN